MALTKENKAELVKKFAKDEKNTGSTEVQIAILTEEIKFRPARLVRRLQGSMQMNEKPARKPSPSLRLLTAKPGSVCLSC